MMQGMTVQELVEAVRAADGAARDYTATLSDLAWEAPTPDRPGGRVAFEDPGGATRELALTPRSHGHVASRLEIPRPFYNRVLEQHPGLWRDTVAQLSGATNKAVMLRTADDNLRALLSSSYRRMDNWPVLREVAGFLGELPGVEVVSKNGREGKMGSKIGAPKRDAVEVLKGDWMRTGVAISNSEVGEGSFSVRGFAERLVCLNGMVVPVDVLGIRRTHLGKRLSEPGDRARELVLSDETVRAEAHALALMARDVMAEMFAPEAQLRLADRLRDAAQDRVTGHVVPAVQELARVLVLTEEETSSVLDSLLRAGGDPTRYSMIQAVTDASKQARSYDRATEMEAAGGKILTLPSSTWRKIATAEAPAAVAV